MKPTMSSEEFLAYRHSLKKDQAQMGELLGVTHGAVDHWEKGRRRIPETTVRLINLFKKYPQLVLEY